MTPFVRQLCTRASLELSAATWHRRQANSRFVASRSRKSENPIVGFQAFTRPIWTRASVRAVKCTSQ
jgi:hypothetical protein